MGRVQAGNPALIKLDGIAGKTFQGWVESTSGGTGSVFSLFPPDNATGNFVRVVQRLPVRIRFAEAENYQNRMGAACMAATHASAQALETAEEACARRIGANPGGRPRGHYSPSRLKGMAQGTYPDRCSTGPIRERSGVGPHERRSE
jgi:hypothetical protein